MLHMSGSPQSDESAFSADPRGVLRAGSAAADAAADHAPPSAFDERELEAALQLLVERALYITGATGTALAIPQGDEMVCRASAGACAPAIGARLQVRSGLTGESIARRQLLRCDNAETDPRVNLETCRELGIASIVVLPLFRRNGEVRGLFELFSDHPYAFEERDLVALERMAALTTTALDLAERRQESAPAASARADEPAEAPPLSSSGAIAPVAPLLGSTAPGSSEPASIAPPSSATCGDQLPEVPAENVSPAEGGEDAATSSSADSFLTAEDLAPIFAAVPDPAPADSAAVPEVMRRVQKCASCGFPISSGRTLCLDCEKRDVEKKENEKRLGAQRGGGALGEVDANQSGADGNPVAAGPPADSLGTAADDDMLPAFLANSLHAEESWVSRHLNLLAFVVLIVAIFVAFVVFFR